MQLATRTTEPYRTTGQKTLSTLANVTSATGHTAGVFGGVAVGVNVAKAMDNNGINSGISIAAGIVSAIAVMAGASIVTECVSGAMRKKVGVDSPFSMLCTQQNFNPEDYSSLLKNIKEGDYDSDIQPSEH